MSPICTAPPTGDCKPFTSVKIAGTVSVSVSCTTGVVRSPTTTPGCVLPKAVAVLLRVSLGLTPLPSTTEKIKVALLPAAMVPPVKVTVPAGSLLNVKPAGVVTSVMEPNFERFTASVTRTSCTGPVPVLLTTMLICTVSPASACVTLNSLSIVSTGSTTVTVTGGGVLGGTPSPGMSKVAMLSSVV